MKAVTISKYGDQSVLTYGDIERPKPKSDEMIVHNRAVAVNPVDWKIRNGLGEMFGLQLPIVLGCEIAGTIDEVGSDVRDFHGAILYTDTSVCSVTEAMRNIVSPSQVKSRQNRKASTLTMQPRSQWAA